ncbi:hypothetical protein FG386_001500 [Cryptosporidium ryanae]|uniref:uncharacterized protein n=1 Tax=Cryptosporidium ryanae TaxID=515981 RepID=UPI00351A07A4|nr:hypothetical protein FG386_001500 [Cryptosporidium ryanae]
MGVGVLLLLINIFNLGVVFSLDCNNLNTLSDYLSNRGGSFQSAKCVSVVLSDPTDPQLFKSPSCDILVVDSTDSKYNDILKTAGVECPVLSPTFPVIFRMNQRPTLKNFIENIYCVESTFPPSTLFKGILNAALNDSANTLLLPVIPSDTGNFQSRVSTMAFEVRNWMMSNYGNNLSCPFKLVIPAFSNSNYNTVLEGFALAFARDQNAYKNSIKEDTLGLRRPVVPPRPTRQPPPVPPRPTRQPPPIPPRPTRQPPPIPPRPTRPSESISPTVPLLRDLNQYDGIACPTMKNLHTLLSELNDPYMNKYTAVTTQVSIAHTDFSFGLFSCDMIIMDSDSYNFSNIMNEMGLSYSNYKREPGVTIRSPKFIQNEHEWFSSLSKVIYMSLSDAIEEVNNYASLLELIRDAYLNILKYASRSNLSELLILPFGLWSNNSNLSDKILSVCIDALGEALNTFLVDNDNIHVTIITNSIENLAFLLDQIKPFFMTVQASSSLLRPQKYHAHSLLRPKSRYYPGTFGSDIERVQTSQYVFTYDNDCMSSSPLSELIQSMFNGRVSSYSTSRNFSLMLTEHRPIVYGCGCLVVDVSSREQLDLALKLGINEKECTSVGSSEIKVLTTKPNPYLTDAYLSTITRVYCVNTTKFLYNSRVEATKVLYEKILTSAKFRCSTLLMPLLSISMDTSENRNKEYLLQAVTVMDSFYQSSPQKDSIHVTLYTNESSLFFLALELFSTYYLEYSSCGGLASTVRSIDKNWMSLRELIGPQAIPEFVTPKKKAKTLIKTLKSKLTKRSSTTTTTTTSRPLRVPPPRPPLPKFTGNPNADRPAPVLSTGMPQQFYNMGTSDFLSAISHFDITKLYSMFYWVNTLSYFSSTKYTDISRQIYLTNSGILPGPENCDVAVVDAAYNGINNILRSIGQSYPVLNSHITVLPNQKYSVSDLPISRTLQRIFVVNVNSRPLKDVYEEIIEKAIANREKHIYIPLFNLSYNYNLSANRATLLVKEFLTIAFYVLERRKSTLKLIIYEENTQAAIHAFDIILRVLSGRERL